MAFSWSTGTDGAGGSFCNYLVTATVKLDTLKWLHILKIEGLNLGVWRYAALRATSNPLWYCLKYAGSLISDENALHAGSRVTMVMGGWRVLTDL